MTDENKILLTQNTSNILPNVKGKEEEIKSEYSKLLSIEDSIYKQNERLGKQNLKSFTEIIEERKIKIETKYKKYLTKELKDKLQKITDRAKESCTYITIIKENTQQNEREYTEQEIQNIIITNIIKIAVNVLKKDENNIEGIKKRTILRLNEIRAKENKVTQKYFNTILQSQEQVQKFENLSQVLQQFSREINADYFNLQSSY